MRKVAPYGSWESPVTAEFVAGKDRSLATEIQTDGDTLYFLEARPDEGGRLALMRLSSGGKAEEALPSAFNVRTRYLEYGGTSFLVNAGTIYFVNFADQQVYRCQPGGQPIAITKEPESRFADLQIDLGRGRLLAVREHTGKPESKNTICAIALASGAVTDLVEGHDFFLAPRLNERADRLVWLSWDHPNMAWNGTELWLGRVSEDGKVHSPQQIAGDRSHGVCQPRWEGDDVLFVAELGDWFNLYRWRSGTIENLYPAAAEFAYPDWTPGQSLYALHGDTICAAFVRNGEWRFLQIEGARVRELPETFSRVDHVVSGVNGFFAMVSFADKPPALVHIGLGGAVRELYRSYDLRLPKECLCVPQAIRFPTAEGEIGHAWLYLPQNDVYVASAGEKPPLVVMCHGGPTAMSAGDFRKGTLFWTTRGYAVVDVNYGGSTGYGRQYRERIRGRWGEVDVQDCLAVVKHLATEGLVDPRRVAIRGGSAGGYTTLAALTFTTGAITVGASYFGVSDLSLLAKETHKLESRYMDQLIGTYPEAKAVYEARSPLAHVDQLNCPIIFFQGDEDKVVPANQSELMHKSLKKKGIASEYHLYAGEGHGFRRAENLQHCLKAEHAFYARFFGFAVQAQDAC